MEADAAGGAVSGLELEEAVYGAEECAFPGS